MLVSLWFFVALLTLSAAAGALGVLLELRRWSKERHLLPALAGWPLALSRLGGAFLCLCLTLAAVLDGVNRHFQYIPSWAALFGNISPDLTPRPLTVAELAATPPAATPPPSHGVVERVQIGGGTSGISRPAYVYLPPAYFDGTQPNRRFPVLYLIHGSPGTYEDWLRGGYVDRTMDALLKRHAIEPFIVVLPDANGGYLRDLECQNVVNGPQDQTYLVREVTSFVDHRYRTIDDRLGRAVGGLSTGGYCGLNFTFRHGDVFSAAVSHSGNGHPDQNFYTGNLFAGNRQLYWNNSPDLYLNTTAVTQPSGVYLDDGAGDNESYRANQRLYTMLVRRGVGVTWNTVQHEGHTFVAFRKNLNLSLPWVSHWFVNHTAPTGTDSVRSPDDSYLPPPSLSDQGLERPPGRPFRPLAPLPGAGAGSGGVAARNPAPPAPTTTVHSTTTMHSTTTVPPTTTVAPTTTVPPTTTSRPPPPSPTSRAGP